MPINFDAPVDPIDLTTFVRRVPTPDNLVLSQLFPAEVRDAMEVNFSEITKTNRAARFRAPDGRIHVADRDGADERVISMIPLSDSRNQGEYERLRRQMQRLGGTRTSALEQATYNDAEDLTRYVQNRAELALGDVLDDGAFSPDELTGVTVDYGMPVAHKITSATSWGTASTDGFAQLIAAADVYEATNGERPGFGITTRAEMRKLLKQTSLINAVKGAQTGVTRISLADTEDVFADEGLPTTWYVVETKIDYDGVTTPIIKPNKVILGPSNPADLLSFRYGTTATAMELVDSGQVDFAFEDAPGIVGVTVKEGPPFREFTFVDALGIPLLKDARKLMTITTEP